MGHPYWPTPKQVKNLPFSSWKLFSENKTKQWCFIFCSQQTHLFISWSKITFYKHLRIDSSSFSDCTIDYFSNCLILTSPKLFCKVSNETRNECFSNLVYLRNVILELCVPAGKHEQWAFLDPSHTFFIYAFASFHLQLRLLLVLSNRNLCSVWCF